MNTAAEIMSALTEHDARLVIEGDRVRLLFPPGHPPPTELINAAREHKEALRTVLEGDRANCGGAYGDVLTALRSKCPDLIEPDRWEQAIQDADCFLAKWGAQAHALGWTARELFGLHPVPARPAPTYRRLSRYDETGLLWHLQGRAVVALTTTEAAIQGASNVLIYRKHRKPALGPVGDCLDDMGAGS